MRIIGELPVDESYYKKVFPSFGELLFAEKDYKPPMTYTFLISAFHKLCQDVNSVVQLAASK